MTEYIVYVKMLKNKRLVIGKMQLNAFNGIRNSAENHKDGKLVYFELKKSIREAQLVENKFKTLKRNILINKIRIINQELLDLKQTLNNDISFFKEINY